MVAARRTSPRGAARAGSARRRGRPRASAWGSSSPTAWPSARTATGTSGVRFVIRERQSARDDERPRVERVRRDERDRHRVEAPHEHRPAVREVVGRRAGRRRADHPVAGLDAEVLAADLPAELDHPAEPRARRDRVVDRVRWTRRRRRRERRELDDRVVAARTPARRPSSSSSASTLVRKPTRPKLTPNTGTSVPRNVRSARSIVPSPPRTIATSGSSVGLDQLDARLAPRLARTRSRASPIVAGLPCVTTAARRDRAQPTAASIRASSTLRGAGPVRQVEEELAVALRPGQARVGHAAHVRVPGGRRVHELAQHAAVHLRVADDAALADVRAGRPRTAASRARARASPAPRRRARAAAPWRAR